MYIIINKKPIDVFKITAVSNPIDITRNRYGTCLSYLSETLYDSWKQNVEKEYVPLTPIMSRIFSEISKETTIYEVTAGVKYFRDAKDIPSKTYGWYFTINYNEREKFLVSKSYATEKECYDAMKRLLELINTIRYTVSEVEI